jgi:hypothetical protein
VAAQRCDERYRVAIAINGGTAIGTLTIPVASAAAGQYTALMFQSVNSKYAVNEGDVISFTPSGASGSNIACNFSLILDNTAS